MTHDLDRICAPSVFGATVWLCTCGHRSWSAPDYQAHQETA